MGRERELAALHEFLRGDPPPRALVLTGSPGAGKTTLWEAGVAAAREHGLRVLAARPSSAEAQLSFTALIDLLDGVEREALADLPAPQLHALEVVLLRTDPMGPPPQPHAIAVGLLNALRALAARESLLVAVDDIQWLDPQSTGALTAAARRLDGEPVRFLLAKRSRGSSALEPALEGGGLERLEAGPLSLGALRQLLAERLGFRPSRRILLRIADSTLGNPLFALELARNEAASTTRSLAHRVHGRGVRLDADRSRGHLGGVVREASRLREQGGERRRGSRHWLATAREFAPTAATWSLGCVSPRGPARHTRSDAKPSRARR